MHAHFRILGRGQALLHKCGGGTNMEALTEAVGAGFMLTYLTAVPERAGRYLCVAHAAPSPLRAGLRTLLRVDGQDIGGESVMFVAVESDGVNDVIKEMTAEEMEVLEFVLHHPLQVVEGDDGVFLEVTDYTTSVVRASLSTPKRGTTDEQ